MSIKGAPWREAATLILAAQTSPVTSLLPGIPKSNFQVLMMRRSSRSKFLPNSCVFPGGVVEDLDFDWRWKTLYQKVTQLPFEKLCQQLRIGGQRPPAIACKRESQFPPEVGFRIAAIRETFEESGILLLTPKEYFQGGHQVVRNGIRAVRYLLSDSEAESWRQRVRKDCGEFYTLCEDLDAVPDVWSLCEWCNWLTPWEQNRMATMRGVKQTHRFDTMFYLCCLEATPVVRTDEMEVTAPQWDSPDNLLYKYQKGDIMLITPQVNELTHMSTKSTLKELCDFAHQREPLGIERMMSINISTADGVLALYPGDDMYPDKPDWEGVGDIPTSDKTCEELQNGVTNLNRIIRNKEPNKPGLRICNVSRMGYPVPNPHPLLVSKV